GTACRHELEPDAGQRREADHVQHRDADQHGQIGARRPRESSCRERQDDERHGSEARTDGDRPERWHGGEDHLVHRPRETPREDDDDEQGEADTVRRRARRRGQDAQGFGSAVRAVSAWRCNQLAASGTTRSAAPSALSTPKPHAPSTTPPRALPTAPIRPMTRSARPWMEARSWGESASVRSALAETKARFQPTPLRKRPAITTLLARPAAPPPTPRAP